MKTGAMRILALLLGLAAGAAAPVRAVDVLYVEPDQNTVVIRQDAKKPWRLGDTVCLPPDKQGVRCGKVIRVARAGLTVFLTLRAQGIDVDLDGR